MLPDDILFASSVLNKSATISPLPSLNTTVLAVDAADEFKATVNSELPVALAVNVCEPLKPVPVVFIVKVPLPKLNEPVEAAVT